MTQGFSVSRTANPALRDCPSCGQRSVRYPVETIRLVPPPSAKPAFVEVQELHCVHCSQRCIRLRVATANVPSASEEWKACYLYREAVEPLERPQAFVLRQTGFPTLPRVWTVEEIQAPAGIVHRHLFPPEAIERTNRLRDVGQKRLAALWPLVLTFWETRFHNPDPAPPMLAARKGP